MNEIAGAPTVLDVRRLTYEYVCDQWGRYQGHVKHPAVIDRESTTHDA
jgi:hypothetical protein